MTGGGGDAPLPPAENGGEFLLSLLKRPQHNPHPQLQSTLPPLQLQQSPTLDPAVAAIGPTIPFVPPWSSDVHDPQPLLPPWLQTIPYPYPPNFYELPQNSFPAPRVPGNQLPVSPIPIGNFGITLGDDLRRVGFQIDAGAHRMDALVQQQELKLKFGSLPSDIYSPEASSNGDSLLNRKFHVAQEREGGWSRSHNELDKSLHLDPKATSTSGLNSNMHVNVVRHVNQDAREQERRGVSLGNSHHTGNYGSMPTPETRRPPPPGFQNKPKGYWGSGAMRRGSDLNEYREVGHSADMSDINRGLTTEKGRVRTLPAERSESRGNKSSEVGLSEQLDRPGPPAGSNLHSVSASEIEGPLLNWRSGIVEDGVGVKYQGVDKLEEEDIPNHGRGDSELDELGDQFVDSLLLQDGHEGKTSSKYHRSSREKDVRSDSRGQQLLSQRARMYKSRTICRSDIDSFEAPFLAIYESLIPPEEEKAQQKQLLTLLEKLVSKEWPNARLYLYGSCANSFGVSKSDIDVCLAIEETDMDKSDIVLKLANILQSDNLQNVQALTRARVPIVKLKDPVTGISCDICINNLLAVVNTKLLRDYAQIDSRLRQLAFIIKHWAKSRGVNETYQGTLSSYAYVLMCIHFLQHRRPAILPCLQEMETTYSVTVEDIECSYFDQVEKLRDFGYYNKENIAQLVWGFFSYWAYRHDYANAVISVRTGSIISKQEKDWTRRIGNDRHLICIEDPFETRHDLGRVVDKYSIKVLREEFERAAEIMQYDPNPCVKLFEPYIPS
ncbi:hypothetical protein L6164_000840 [Bauhinia variegata]|uniref:Uncharacterized protein n=1 Tax=Bauhinia variegata TaxID=167791 RepID=A0ACB9Q7Z3_BAUVA|nr:hypothetical protein L6164_000840 [Bauhinia variegata]